VLGIAATSDGGVCTAGYFSGTVTVYSADGTAIGAPLDYGGDFGAFAIKYSSTGVV
jgi:hypothetical protein